MQEQQIKTKKRVADFGEVYTAKRQVRDMLDLVKEQSYDPNATFLEPACGNGNFLAEILRRKLSTVLFNKNVSAEFEIDVLKCLATIYGVDIQIDNVTESRDRLYNILHNTLGNVSYDGFWKSVRLILEKNIICGDTLTATTEKGTTLVFSEWQFKEDGTITRREHLYTDMLNGIDTIGRYAGTYHYMKNFRTEVA